MKIRFFQITRLATGEVDLIMLLQCVCFIIISLGSLVKFYAFTSQIGSVRVIMDCVKTTWNTTHEDTLAILNRRATVGKQQGAIYAIFIYPSALLLVVFRISSYVVVVTAPPNSNVTDPFPILTDYLIDEEKYFFLIIIHQNVMFFFAATTYVATETLYIMWLQHSIGLFELASYHIEKGVSERPSCISQEVMEAYRKKCLATAVTYHIYAKTFLMYVKGKFSLTYAVLVVFAVISLAINFFRLSTAICVTHNMEEMLLSLLLSISELSYMFYLNYVMQKVVDYADYFRTIVYSTPWYNRSVSVQKILLTILIRCSEPIVFDYYGFYTASVEGFSGMVKTTVSYFTMMTSLQ
ncbi:uncharacterized protein LOC143354272 isoform X2 [Halictus rubicundus]|uniref:uncharacterized protein LOC143354272 isoform X2 n=1 Tax=Halictus rubicundus TaxID=77578 RepID=UPI00403690A7